MENTLSYCSGKIKFYRNKGNDISKYRFIDKRDVKGSHLDFINNGYKIKHKGSTAGTSGTPFSFLRDLRCMVAEQHFQNLYFGWKNKYRVVFRGERIFRSGYKPHKIYMCIPFIKEMYISSYHISDAGLEMAVKKLSRIKNKCLWAYPSTAYILAQYCIKNNKDIHFDFVATSSEMLFDWQIEAIEKAFKCQVKDWYGQAERVAALYRCPNGNYHEVPNYSHIEFCKYNGSLFEIAGTQYHNRIMPLVRYNTHDLVEFNETECPCGNKGINIKVIHGRIGDFIHTGTDTKTATGLYCAFFKDARRINGAQICIDKDNKIVVKIVREECFNEEDEQLLIKTIGSHLPEGMFRIQYVSCLERNPSGKLNYVVHK
ncbi:phenylacetate--CoA ligase family protein [Pseudobacteroides cellulosolvens]|uniref:hypothetical protein n=1 Tax=Pseudobacteroides cellulosolvens TaxID=35825 RepID=UPI00128F5C88|nr:hypothetical protein [Pseudobacteroides cellulosolvens]